LIEKFSIPKLHVTGLKPVELEVEVERVDMGDLEVGQAWLQTTQGLDMISVEAVEYSLPKLTIILDK
jgi:hypothetical protein